MAVSPEQSSRTWLTDADKLDCARGMVDFEVLSTAAIRRGAVMAEPLIP